MDSTIRKIASEYGIPYNMALKIVGEKMGNERINGRIEEQMYNIGAQLGKVFGGENPPPKGALAALLSGLDANISIK